MLNSSLTGQPNWPKHILCTRKAECRITCITHVCTWTKYIITLFYTYMPHLATRPNLVNLCKEGQNIQQRRMHEFFWPTFSLLRMLCYGHPFLGCEFIVCISIFPKVNLCGSQYDRNSGTVFGDLRYPLKQQPEVYSKSVLKINTKMCPYAKIITAWFTLENYKVSRKHHSPLLWCYPPLISIFKVFISLCG